jgi:hypothetical protein
MTVRTQLIAAGCGVVFIVTLAGAGAGIAAFAAPPTKPPSARTCFHVRDVDGVSVASPIGDKKQDGVNIRLNNRDVYQIALSGPCYTLQHSKQIGIESRSVTGSICDWSDAVVIARDGDTGERQQCWATSLHKLTADEFAAMPVKERP